MSLCDFNLISSPLSLCLSLSLFAYYAPFPYAPPTQHNSYLNFFLEFLVLFFGDLFKLSLSSQQIFEFIFFGGGGYQFFPKQTSLFDKIFIQNSFHIFEILSSWTSKTKQLFLPSRRRRQTGAYLIIPRWVILPYLGR